MIHCFFLLACALLPCLVVGLFEFEADETFLASSVLGSIADTTCSLFNW